jgi:NosR/NirI family nitrous oxide reductase transcriptional regulator
MCREMTAPGPTRKPANRLAGWLGALGLIATVTVALSATPLWSQTNPEEEVGVPATDQSPPQAPTKIEINPEEESQERTRAAPTTTARRTQFTTQPVVTMNTFDPTVTPVPLLDRLTPEVIGRVFDGVDRVEMVNDDGPIGAAAFQNGQMVGYIFSTFDVLRAPGYSTTPFDVIVGVGMDGRIAGATLLFHREPYLLNDRARTGRMIEYLSRMTGMEGRLGAEGGMEPGFVAGATISARAIRNAVLEGARMVLRYRTEDILVTEPTIDIFNFKPMSVTDLAKDGAVALAHVTNADLRAAMTAAGLGDLPPEVPMQGGPDDTYVDFAVGFANPPVVGRNGAGPESFERLTNEMSASTMAIYVGSLAGVYDHRGTKFNNLSNGFLLDRVTIAQGGREVKFSKSQTILSGRTIADLLILPPDMGFDPMQPWTAILHASAVRPDGATVNFELTRMTYELPPQLILLPEATAAVAWIEPWVEGRRDIVILGVALTVLTVILALQHRLSQSRQLHRYVRIGFLLFTLLWIGWTASAQLSIVHLINYIRAPFDRYGLAFYLAEPLIVMLSIYTAITLLILGRGVFCGWLCPFGALQELLAQVSRALRLPQWNPSERAQSRLWMVKYGVLALLIGLAFLDPAMGARVEEVEPFKTAITARFVRGLPYVIYAAILLLIGLFTERAFCRFLCPLGAGLAVLDRLHLVNLLKRRPECGSPCHLCERSCPVRAIKSSGKIVMAECFQCLDCQVEYYDDRRCPPLAQARKRRERAGIPGPDLTFGLPILERT